LPKAGRLASALQQGRKSEGQDSDSGSILFFFAFERSIEYKKKTTPNTHIFLNPSLIYTRRNLFLQPSPKTPKQKLQIREVEGAPAAACKVMNKPNQTKSTQPNPTQFLFTSNYTTHPQRMHKTQTMHQS
jgi:hypothetical protein